MGRRITIALLILLFAGHVGTAQKVCDATSIGLDPVSATTTYWNSLRGGLYPEGSNRRPFEHEMRLRDIAAGIRPCSPSGEPDDYNGKLVIVGIGGKDAEVIFSALAEIGKEDTTTHRGIVYANACGSGITVADLRPSKSAAWSRITSKIQETGASGKQVAVVWLLLDDMLVTDTTFPESANAIADGLADVCRAIKQNLPSVQLVYFSSRTYSGYIDPTESAYNEAAFAPRDHIHGWAIKLLVQRQITGTKGYSFGDVSSEMPALSWSAYLWSDGTKENEDGLAWFCDDFEVDGLLLTAKGARKAANYVHKSFNTDQVARGWYTQRVVTSVEALRNENIRVWSESGTIHVQNAYGQLDVRGLRGNTVWTGSVRGETRIDGSGFASGAYVVTVDGKSFTVILR